VLPLLLALPLLAQVAAPAGKGGIERGIPYRTVAGRELALDVYSPPGDGPHPAVLLVHGGAWTHGDRRDMAPFAELLVPLGYACFSPSYRLAPADHYPAQLEDCAHALQFVRANAARFRVDPARIGALGPSAGGHLVALLGVLDERAEPDSPDPVLRQSSRARCVVSYFGPTLVTKTQELDFDTLPPPQLFGDAPASAYAAASPLLLATADDAPFLFVHGDADTTVPIEHSRLMDEKLRSLGVASELVEIPGGGHGDFFRKDPQGEYWKRTLAFLSRNLQPAPAR
jgi:acetyl esterase/lipase